MASPSPAQNRAMKDQLQARLPNNGSKKDNRPLLGVSTNLQVQGSPVSPKCSDRASSEHSKVPSDLNEDPISPLYSDQDGPRPSSAVQMAAWDRKFILTLDGGGIRGYSTLLIIRELMKICASFETKFNPEVTSSYHPAPYQLPQSSTITQNDNGRNRSLKFLPVHYFDYIAGTSTGGLIAIMLSRLRMNIDECIAEYEGLGKQIFGNQLPLFNIQRRIFSLRGPIPWNREKYDHEKLEKAIQEVVNKRLRVPNDRAVGQMFPSHEERCRTIVISFKDSSASGTTYIFRTYNHHKAQTQEYVFNAGEADKVSIVDVARATTAAPTYFMPKVINGHKYLDGGFGTNANNPSQIAYNEVLLMHGNNPEAVALVVSIGTGKLRNGTPFPKTSDMFSKYWAAINYAVNSASDSENTHRSMSQHMAANSRPYHRFNVDGGLEHIKLGDWKTVSQSASSEPVNVTLSTIRKATMAYCAQKEVRKQLEQTAKMLVRNRQLRSGTSKWNFTATGFLYHCTVNLCLESSILHNSEELLRDHLVAQHADLGYCYPPSTERERTLLEKTIRRGKISHTD